MDEVKILLADVDKQEFIDIKQSLKYSADIITTTTDELIKKALELKPDLILIDLKTSRDLKVISNINNLGIPVIYLITNFNELKLHKYLFEPYYYLFKPLNPVELNYIFQLAVNKNKIHNILEPSENYYKTIFDHTGTATVIIEEDTTISKANAEFERLSGYSREELEGRKSWTDFVNTSDLGRMKEYHYMRREISEAAPSIYDFEFVDRFGNVKNIHLDISMIPGSEKSVASLLDITELKTAQKLLMNKESELSSIYNNVSEIIFSISVENSRYKFIFVNQAFLDVTGLEESHVLGKYVEEVIPEPSLNMVLENYQKAIKEKKTIRWEETTRYPSGDRKGEVTITPLFDSRGRCTKLIGTVHDITKRVEMHKDLLFKTTLLEAQLQSTLDGVLVLDNKQNVVLYNNRFIDMWEIPRSLESKVSRKIFDHLKSKVKFPDTLFYKEFITEKRNYNNFKYIELKNGEILESYSMPLIDSEGNFEGKVWYFRDITEEKHSKEELIDSKNKYTSLFDNAEDGIFLMKGEIFIDCNKKVLELYGTTREQIVGKTPIIFSPELQPDGERSEEKAKKLINKALEGEPQHFEWEHLRYDCSPFTVEVSLNRLKIKEEYLIQAIVRDITERKEATEKINKLYRIYATLSQINQAIVRTDDRDELFETICKVCVEYGKFIMAWIGLIDHKTGDVVPVHYSGFEDGYLDNISLNTKETPSPNKPSTMALKSNEFNICEDIEKDLNRKWKNEALKRNYRSLVSIPLKEKGKIIGILNIYSSKPNFFREEEVDLIKEMGYDISFALDSIKTKKEKEKVEKALKESEKSYRELVDNSLVGVYKTDLNGDVLFANKAMMSIYKFKDFNEMKKHKILVIYKAKEDRQKFIDNLKKEGYLIDYEMETVDMDGKTVNVLISAVLNGNVISGMFMDISDRIKSEKLLLNSEKRYRKLYSSMNEGVAVHRLIYDDNNDPVDYEIVDVNESFEKILGVKKEDIVGKKATEIYNTNKAPYLDIYSEVAQKGDSTNFETFFEPMNKYLNISVFSPSKNTFATVFEDITDRKNEENRTKKSLEEKEVLLREIHHRVKNNLQIIASLLNLQECVEDDKTVGDVLKESMGRVKTMATIHEKLYESPSLNVINFRNFTEKLVYDILYSYGIEVGTIQPKINMEDISLNIDTAMPLGLIINELVTNSVKYAFPNRKGNITITLKSHPENMELTIADDGIGMASEVTPEESDTLGLKLVTNLVDQLDGSYKLNRKDGTEFKIIFKEIKYKTRM